MAHFYRWSVVTEYADGDNWSNHFDTKKEALKCMDSIKNEKEPWIRITLVDNKNKKFSEA